MSTFETIDYLKQGNPRQQRAYIVLTVHAIFEKLSPFQPLLTGTIPINIDIENSDLDIICYWQDKQLFIDHLISYFSNETNFSQEEKIIGSHSSVLARFQLEEFEIELFGQNIPTQEQSAYKHMLIEHQILQQKGKSFRQEIIRLKKEGMKTEPAFAKLLGLHGDPYEALLQYIKM
jgi:hypothetical protein